MTLEFYVSPEGDDEWSGTRPMPNDGGTDGPFATLEAARDAVSATLADGVDQNVVVTVQEGTYYRDGPLTFSTADGGRDGNEVTYRAAPGERPVVAGGRPVDDWEAVGDGTYRARVESEFDTLYEVSENGDVSRAQVARHPTDGYLEVAADTDTPTETFRYAEGDLPDVDVEDLQVHVWPGGESGEWSWFTDTLDVESVDRETRTVTLATPARYPLGAGSRYAFRGPRAFLDAPGEFHLDRDADGAGGVLYYRPDGDVEEVTVVAPATESVIEVRGDGPRAPVRNLRFEGLEIRASDTLHEIHSDDDPFGQTQGLVSLQNVADLTIADCHAHAGGMHGVVVDGAARGVTIRDNWIHNVGHSGIQFVGPDDVRERRVRNGRVTGNHVHHTGQLLGHGSGIQLYYASYNRIDHNRVHHTSRYAISLKGAIPEVPDERVDGLPRDDSVIRELRHTQGNVVEYNDVSHANLDSQDTGVIESWCAGPGNVIHNNRIHHTEIQFSFGFGLYLDDASDEYTVTRNLLHDLGASEDGRLRSAIYVKGVENVFRDNVIADCDVDGGVFGSMKLAGLPNRGLVIHQNVVADCNDSRLHLFRNWDDDRIAYENYNLFHHPDDEYHVDGVPWGRMVTPEGRLDVETLDDWRRTFDRRVPSEYETRYDGDSVTERPRFLDPDLGDYRLRYDSPARDLDIRGVDVAGIGLREGFAYADPDDPLAGVYVWDPRRPGRAHCSLSPGESTDLTVTVRTQWGFVADVDVRYESEDPDVATVEGGEVSAHEAGVATLTATAEDDSEVVTGRFHVVVE